MMKKKSNEISFKKILYIILTVVLGNLAGFIVYEILSIATFIGIILIHELPVERVHIFWLISPLPAYLFWILILAGTLGGFFLGLRWWKMVYVEHRHWKDWYKCKR